jgi:hypothetical protein
MRSFFLLPVRILILTLLCVTPWTKTATAEDVQPRLSGGPVLQWAGDAARLTTTPTAPIARAPNQRYFLYGGQTVALVGLSGETVPHIPSVMGTYYEWCHYDLLFNPTQKKYENCIDLLNQAGVNAIRLWVAFNFEQYPYEHGQPFSFGTCAPGKWDLAAKDDEYFNRIKEVVQYAQGKGIIVEVTLFIPPTGGADPAAGPWASGKNCQNLYFRNPGTTTANHTYFYQADLATGNPHTVTDIDQDNSNKALRQYQVQLMRWVVDALNQYNNVYFELANEPDLSGLTGGVASFDHLKKWHLYMARKLSEYEQQNYPTRRHLIAANLSVRSIIDSILADTQAKIDIISSHYVKATGSKPGVAEVDRLAGIKLLHNYNTYTGSTPGSANKKIWGMNETHITGISGNISATAASARTEAWQLIMNGGGLYDHYSYNWGNREASFNHAESDAARRQLGYLALFVNNLPLASMRRTMPAAGTLWATVPTDAYSSPDLIGCNGSSYCWSAMEERNTKVLYIHHSNLSSAGGFRRYNPVPKSTTSSCAANCLTSCSASCQSSCHVESGSNLSLKNLDTCAGSYVGEWFTPDGTHKDALNNLVAIPGRSFNFTWSPGQTFSIPTPQCYGHDIVLKVRRTGASCP